jgi:hypothetical protein
MTWCKSTKTIHEDASHAPMFETHTPSSLPGAIGHALYLPLFGLPPDYLIQVVVVVDYIVCSIEQVCYKSIATFMAVFQIACHDSADKTQQKSSRQHESSDVDRKNALLWPGLCKHVPWLEFTVGCVPAL